MASNAARGAYFKGRTRKWLIAQGYQVADLEIIRWVFRPGGHRMPVKRDQFGSDLLAMSAGHIVFIQVKGGAQAAGAGQFLDAQREFAKHQFPQAAHLWIVCWPPRARQPRVIHVPNHRRGNHGEEGSSKEDHEEAREEGRAETRKEGTGTRRQAGTRRTSARAAQSTVADDGRRSTH